MMSIARNRCRFFYTDAPSGLSGLPTHSPVAAAVRLAVAGLGQQEVARVRRIARASGPRVRRMTPIQLFMAFQGNRAIVDMFWSSHRRHYVERGELLACANEIRRRRYEGALRRIDHSRDDSIRKFKAVIAERLGWSAT